MNVKLVATDLDETLLQEDGTVSAYTHAVLRRAIDAGVEVVIASGRAYDSLPKELLAVKGIRYAITSNGCAINAVPSGERLHAFLMTEQSVEQCLALLVDYPDCPVTVFYNGVPYANADYVQFPEKYGMEGFLASYIRTTRTPVADVFAFARAHKSEIDSINVNCANTAARDAMIAKISARVGEILCVSSTERLVEVVSAQAGKGAGLRYLCEMLDIDAKDVVACGNANNDVDMLRFAGVGVAVANASDDCRAAADVITAANTADGVARYLESLLA